jgi:hypothetical protein
MSNPLNLLGSSTKIRTEPSSWDNAHLKYPIIAVLNKTKSRLTASEKLSIERKVFLLQSNHRNQKGSASMAKLRGRRSIKEEIGYARQSIDQKGKKEN